MALHQNFGDQPTEGPSPRSGGGGQSQSHEAAVPWIALLAASYLAKRKLLAQWDKAARTGDNDLTYSSASNLVALSIPWDLTLGLLSRDNVLFRSRRDRA